METTPKTHARTCIGCGKQADKRSMLRIVRTGEGRAAFDPTGRAPGRGAYVCSALCLEGSRKGSKLSRALKCPVSLEDLQEIAGQLAQASAPADK